MGIVDQAIEYGVGIGRIADDLVPDPYRLFSVSTYETDMRY